jgi:hypothetical protein
LEEDSGLAEDSGLEEELGEAVVPEAERTALRRAFFAVL